MRFELRNRSYERLKENLSENSRAKYGEIVEIDGKEFLVIIFETCALILEALYDEV